MNNTQPLLTATASLSQVLYASITTAKPALTTSSFLVVFAFSYLVQVVFYLTTGLIVGSFSRITKPLVPILRRNARNLLIKCSMLGFAFVVISRNENKVPVVTPDLKGLLNLAYLAIAVLLLHDTTFFFTHYALHTKLLFKRWHAMHHTIYEPVGIDCYYESVLDHMANDLFVMYMPLIFNMDFWVILMFCTVETVASVVAHSGLDFDFIQYHDIHHRRERYNYAALFPWWDMLFGTYKDPSVFKRKQYLKNYTSKSKAQ